MKKQVVCPLSVMQYLQYVKVEHQAALLNLL